MIPNAGKLLVACLAGAQLSGCATDPSNQVPRSVRSAAAIESAFNRLAALAELEAFDPSTADLSGIIALIDPSLPRPIPTGSETHRRATRTLDSLLAQFPVPTPAGDVPEVSSEDRAEAVKLYARARLATQSGDPASAAALLDHALNFDPASASVWRELGEARFELGERESALEALRVAAELGSSEPRVFLLLASDGASRGDTDEIIRWSGAVRSSDASPVDRALADAMLGSALIERGNLRAGADALDAALSVIRGMPPAPGEPTEFLRLRSRAADLAARAGDAWAALGEPAQAARTYATVGDAADAPVAIAQRLLASEVASGRPAHAALSLLERVRTNAGDLNVEEARWARALSGVDRVGGALMDAMAEAADEPGLPASARQMVVRTIVRAERDPESAFRRFLNAGDLGMSSVVAGDALWRLDPDRRLTASIEGVRQNAVLARPMGAALSRLVPEPMRLAETLAASDRPAERGLALGIAWELRTPDAVRALLVAGPGATGGEWLDPTLAAELCGFAGMWNEAGVWLDAARADQGVSRARLIGALIACQRLNEAAELGPRIQQDPGATAEDLLAAAEIASLTGQNDLASLRIERASEADPFDERVWERRIANASAAAEADGGESLRDAGRQLAERRPRSALFSLLRARDLGSQGRMEDAARLIMSIDDREPGRDLGLALLVQATGTAHAQQPGSDLVAQVAAWLEQRAEALPGSVAGAIAYADVRSIIDPGEAVELLDDAAAQMGHPEIDRTAERILAFRLDGGEESAMQRVLARTQRHTGVDTSIERAEASNLAGEHMQAIGALRAALPTPGSLTEAQRQRWLLALLGVAQSTDGENSDEAVAAGALALMNEIEARGMPMPEPVLRARVILMVRVEQTDELIRLVMSGALTRENELVVVQALLGSDQRDAGLDLLAHIAAGNTDNAIIDTPMVQEWIRLVGAGGNARHVRTMLDLLGTPERAHAVAEALRERYALVRSPGEQNEARDRADIAYTGALLANVFEREAESEALYRLCIGLDPDHAWACNDLGYALADRGVSLDEAERLAVRAFELLPDEASVGDTLGWARYKLGVLADEVDADGNVVRRGAVTLLTEASQLEEGGDNSTIFWHLGDALWRLGRRSEAVEAWMAAETMLAATALDIAAEQNPNPRRRDQVAATLSEVRRRLTSVKDDRDPPVAPIPSLDAP